MSNAPVITERTWGEVVVEGHGAFRDAKLWPGGARGWDWDETGTRHTPGIQPADVEELIDHGAEVVVLAQGVHERLGVTDATHERLDEAGVAVHVLPTPEAVARYNELAEAGEAVGALIHSTC
jgi:hypothetical protein